MSEELRINWKAISWQSFQFLCCRLLYRVYGYDVRPSKTMGADGGIDALIFVRGEEGREIVVQCKHWTHYLTLSKFKNELDKEISKINKAGTELYSYLFMTSYELTREMKEYFEKKLSCCKFRGDCIDALVLEIWLNENQDIRQEVFGKPLLRHNWESLISVCREQARKKLDSVSESGKYVKELYVDRGMEGSINEFMLGDKRCFLVIGKAGSGKTNLTCHMTEEYVNGIRSDWPCVFLLGANVIIEDERSLVRRLLSELSYDENLNAEVAGANLEKMLSEKERSLVIYIDGINENANIRGMNKSIKYLMEFVRGKRVKLCISCRDIFWDYFRDCFIESEVYLYKKSDLDVKRAFYVAERSAAKGILGLDDFSEEEYESALSRYFAHFSITGSITGEAKEKCYHPLLLRFFCEAYQGEDIGNKADLHLLDLFELYWNRKLENIRANLGLRTEYRLAEFLVSLSELLKERKTNSIPISTIVKEMGMEIDSSESIYTRILDEHIILEEDMIKPQKTRIVRFVYDEFFEYVMARGLWDKMGLGIIDEGGLKEEIGVLAVESADFPHYQGLIQYLLLMIDRKEKKLLKEVVGYLAERADSGIWLKTIAALLDGVEIMDDEITDILVKWTRSISKEVTTTISSRSGQSSYKNWKLSYLSGLAQDMEYEIKTILRGREGKLNIASAKSIEKLALAIRALITYQNSSLIRRFGFNELLLIANRDPELANKIAEKLDKKTQRKWVIGADKLMALVGNMSLKDEGKTHSEYIGFSEELKKHSQEDYMIHYVEGILTTDEMARWGICNKESIEGLSQTIKRIKIIKVLLNGILETLTPRENVVIISRYGLGLPAAETLEIVGKQLSISRERVRQIEAKALRKMRHPSRSRKLKDFIDVISERAFYLPEYHFICGIFGEWSIGRKKFSFKI